MFGFDPFDLDDPENVVLVAGSGILDDEDDTAERCSCWCDCRRRVDVPGEVCQRCLDGRHWTSEDEAFADPDE